MEVEPIRDFIEGNFLFNQLESAIVYSDRVPNRLEVVLHVQTHTLKHREHLLGLLELHLVRLEDEQDGASHQLHVLLSTEQLLQIEQKRETLLLVQELHGVF